MEEAEGQKEEEESEEELEERRSGRGGGIVRPERFYIYCDSVFFY